MEDDTGVLLLGEENYGRVLFGKDYLPRPFEQTEENIGDNTVDVVLEDPQTPKRLIIEPEYMKDAVGEPIYLDIDQTREKFETMHLRLTNQQIDVLKSMGFAELVYSLEYARLRIPLSLLQSAIHLEGEPEDAPLTNVDMYDFVIEQVDEAQMTERETAAMQGLNAMYPMYRLDVNAVVGTYPEPAVPAEATEDGEVTAGDVEETEVSTSVQYDSSITPDVDYVMDRLNYVSDISGTSALSASQEGEAEAEAEAASPALPAGCVSQVFFNANILQASSDGLTPDQVVRIGARNGGIVEIYGTLEEAQARDSYLAGFDGTLFSDYHARVGACVVRLSCRLNENQRKVLEQEIVQALTDGEPSQVPSGFSQTLPTLYPVLNSFNSGYAVTVEPEGDAPSEAEATDEEDPEEVDDELIAEPETGTDWQEASARLELVNADSVDLTLDNRQIFVSGEVNTPEDGAVTLSTFKYLEGADDQYAKVYPMGSGLYGVVGQSEEDDEDYEDEEEFDEEEDAEDEEEEDEEIEDEEEEAEEDEAPAPGPSEDPDPFYAYLRSSGEGDMYWLVNTQDRTVEFYREDTGTYQIGDYTGSLKNGMTVQFRDSGSMVEIRLRYPQTYKFATYASNGTDVMIEQQDVGSVETVMAEVR